MVRARGTAPEDFSALGFSTAAGFSSVGVCVAGYASTDAAAVMETVVAMEEHRDILREINFQFLNFPGGHFVVVFKNCFLSKRAHKGGGSSSGSGPQGAESPLSP